MAPPVIPGQDPEVQENTAAVRRERWKTRVREERERRAAAPGDQQTEGRTATAVRGSNGEGQQQQQQQEDGGFFSFKDQMRSVFNGGVSGFNELANFFNSATEWGAEQYLKLPESMTGAGGRGLAELWSEETEPLQVPKYFGESTTTIGKFTEVITQFAVGLVGVGKFVGTAKGAGRLAQFTNMTLRGAAVDFSMFDPYEDTLAEIAEDIGPEFTRELASYVASDEDDSEAEARFKNAIEGAALGGAVDTFLFLGGRILRNVKKAKLNHIADESAVGRELTPEEVAARKAGDPVDEATYLRRARDADKEIISDEQLGKEITDDLDELDATLKEADEAAGEATEHFGNRGDAMAYNASIRAAKSAAERQAGMSDESLTLIKDTFDQMKEITDPNKRQAIWDNADFNFNHSESPEEVKDLIASISEVEGNPFATRRLGQETFAETSKLAENLFQGATSEEASQLIAATFGTTEQLPALIAGARKYLYSAGQRAARLAARFDMNPDDAIAADQMAEAIQHLFDVAQMLAGASSNVGRALNIHNLQVGAEVAIDATGRGVNTVTGETAHALTGMTREEIRQLGRMLRHVDGDPSKIVGMTKAHRSKAARRTMRDPRATDEFIELMMNSMLSSPKTHMVNILTTTVASAIRPAEMMLAGTFRGNLVRQREGWDTMVGLFAHMGEAWKMSRKAFKLGRNMLDPESMVDDRSIAQIGAIGRRGPKFTKGLGKFLRLPSRMLLTGDELLKQMNYRGQIRAKSLKLARQDGLVDPHEIAKRLDDDMRMSFDPEGGARNRDAMLYSREQTFTSELEYGFGKSIQDFGKKHPLFRILAMPFIRTPVNLMRWTWKHTPGLGALNREMRAAWKAGGDERAMMLAKQSTGTMIYGTAALFAFTGNITGRGPSNPDIRRLWLVNNQPYSIKVPGTDIWVSYARADPILTAFGVVADGVTAWGENNDETMLRWATTVIASLAANVSNKTFMQSTAEIFDMMASGNAYDVEKFIKSRALTMVPFSALQRAVVGGMDPVWREAEMLTDELLRNTPGMSDNLPPTRNIFGEPVLKPAGFLNRVMNPFTVSKPLDVDDDVMDTIIEIGRGMGMPAEEKFGVKLKDRNKWGFEGQSPYDRMTQLLGESDGGKGQLHMPETTLREEMTKLVRSEDFQNASGGTSAQPGGVRYDMVSSLVHEYQDIAMEVMLDEPGFEKVKNAVLMGEVVEKAGYVGGDEAAEEAEREWLERINN